VPGDNLWNLSEHFYGYGPHYRVIYEANASQIRNPRLIYPDQIFVVPEKPVD
jgi:nucleoid-associated protein YgaU